VRIGEPGGQREVKVAVGRVPGGVRQEAVLGQQFLQILGALGDAVRREAHVLNDQRGTVGALLSDDAEESVADRQHRPLPRPLTALLATSPR
jgi:hypothetical protein